MERGVQSAKKAVRARVTEHAELVMTSTALMGSCVEFYMAQHDCLDVTHMLPGYRKIATTDTELPLHWGELVATQ